MSCSDNYSEYHSSTSGYDYEVHSNSNLPKSLDFSLDEIRQQLNKLGFSQIPDLKLLDIKKDLDEIIVRDESLQGTVRFPASEGLSDWFMSGDDADNDDSSLATVTSLTQSDPYKVKRKISRKKSSNLDNYETLSGNSTPRNQYNELMASKNKEDSEYFRKVSFPSDPVNDVFNYTGVSLDSGKRNDYQDFASRPSSKSSFIKIAQHNNVDRGWRRHDPVTRYHRYKTAWEHNKAPGESPHKELRWAVKAAMMVKEVPQPREQRIKSSKTKNTYQIPGENKRSDLRWQVRQEIANPDIYFD